ncbi:histone deacetylase 10-like protein [Lasius niger]|uniref:Histone deacetylase 10-like protein n=1 Tax=Lasius niger TaxID=67767 RepID=A0A0J7KAI9_LASNI|nr:histone deacetylase 10-like protein [Lasius niger]
MGRTPPLLFFTKNILDTKLGLSPLGRFSIPCCFRRAICSDISGDSLVMNRECLQLLIMRGFETNEILAPVINLRTCGGAPNSFHLSWKASS